VIEHSRSAARVGSGGIKPCHDTSERVDSMAKRKSGAKVPTQKKPMRAHIPDDIEYEVVMRCKRHCCMCYGLDGLLKAADGQLAHLGRDPSKVEVDDLAYLCLECHKKYDTKNNRVLSYKPTEIRGYRTLLYKALRHEHIEWTITLRANFAQSEKVRGVVREVHKRLMACCTDVTLNEGPMM
jgi:hypothetical protein